MSVVVHPIHALRAPVRRAARLLRATVAGVVARCLEAEGVDTVHLLPGGPIMPLVEALFLRHRLRMVMAAHETGAVFMADGHQRVAGGVGVAIVTAGPGATNALTGAACAMRDGIPVVVITGQPGLSALGREPAQDSSSMGVDVVELFRRVSKMSVLVTDPDRIGDVMAAAFRSARSGRPGVAHVAIPADLLRRPATYRPSLGLAGVPGPRPVDLAAVERGARLLIGVRRLVVIAGSGVRRARAFHELRAVAERLGAPLATTPAAKGVLPEDHPLSLQVFGFAGSPLAERVIFDRRTDGLLVIGSRMGELSSHAWDPRLGRKRIVQIDIDAAELGRNFPIEVGICGDARETLRALDRALGRHPRRSNWVAPVPPVSPGAVVLPPGRCLDHSKMDDERAPLAPQRVVAGICRALPADGVLFVDVGACMAFAIHYPAIRNPNGFHLNLSFASMGHAVAAVVGAQVARPQTRMMCLCGDAAFMMMSGEVHTAVLADAPCVWVVLNNGGMSSVRTGARRQFGTQGRRRKMLAMTRYPRPIDAAGMARAMGALGFRVARASDLDPTLREALAAGRPAVVDARVDIDEEPPMGLRLALLDRFFSSKGGSR